MQYCCNSNVTLLVKSVSYLCFSVVFATNGIYNSRSNATDNIKSVWELKQNSEHVFTFPSHQLVDDQFVSLVWIIMQPLEKEKFNWINGISCTQTETSKNQSHKLTKKW